MATPHPVREDAVASGARGPAEAAAAAEAHAVVIAALERLPADQQEAFCLKFQDHLSYREIGEVMGKSLGTVSNLISVALGAVRRELRAGGHLAQEG